MWFGGAAQWRSMYRLDHEVDAAMERARKEPR